MLGEKDDLQLNVTIENKGDSAYEAQLFIKHQESVSYIAASKGSVICNQLNKTFVVCSLGNPMRRNRKSTLILRFDPSGLEDSEPRVSFRIFANSTSKQIEPKDDLILDIRVVKKADISIQGFVFNISYLIIHMYSNSVSLNSWAIPEQSFYGGVVKGESVMQFVDDIGTSVQHTYQVR